MLDIELVETPKTTLLPERVKEFLMQIYNKSEYKVIFSDNKPKSTLGDYRYKEQLITLYYQHFNSNNDLMKTAIHELAHHIDYTKHGRRDKPHTGSFKKILEYAESIAYDKKILIETPSSELDIIFNKAMEFGEAVLNYADKAEDNHGMETIQKKLYGASKKSIRHYATLYNSLKDKY